MIDGNCFFSERIILCDPLYRRCSLAWCISRLRLWNRSFGCLHIQIVPDYHVCILVSLVMPELTSPSCEQIPSGSWCPVVRRRILQEDVTFVRTLSRSLMLADLCPVRIPDKTIGKSSVHEIAWWNVTATLSWRWSLSNIPLAAGCYKDVYIWWVPISLVNSRYSMEITDVLDLLRFSMGHQILPSDRWVRREQMRMPRCRCSCFWLELLLASVQIYQWGWYSTDILSETVPMISI